MSETAEVTYKTTDYYVPDDQETLAWDDPILNIDWVNIREPILSAKDKVGKSFEQCHKYD
jgi:dTDP-4-dehydrorhamnose 3,5-epimerase